MPNIPVTRSLKEMIEKVPLLELGNLIAILQILGTEPKERTLEEFGIVSSLNSIAVKAYTDRGRDVPKELRQ